MEIKIYLWPCSPGPYCLTCALIKPAVSLKTGLHRRTRQQIRVTVSMNIYVFSSKGQRARYLKIRPISPLEVTGNSLPWKKQRRWSRAAWEVETEAVQSLKQNKHKVMVVWAPCKNHAVFMKTELQSYSGGRQSVSATFQRDKEKRPPLQYREMTWTSRYISNSLHLSWYFILYISILYFIALRDKCNHISFSIPNCTPV